jgi:L-asparagine transporter-like permease
MKWYDWVLIAAWAAYFVFLGPWLISAPSWIAVGLGFALLVGLVVVTSKRVFHE